jgi:hypothetical protein
MKNNENETSIEAYDSFRYNIAMINFRCRIFECLISTLLEGWGIQKMPQPARHDYYYENEGVHGYAERVVPPLFELSPFFSELN